MAYKSIRSDETGMARWLLVVLIIVGVLAVGSIGYAVGKNRTEDEAKKAYDKKTQQLQEQLSAAKTSATDKVEEGQEAVEEGQKTNEQLAAENAQLKTTVEHQKQQIADLQKQLDEAKTPTPSPTPPSQ